MRTKLFLSGIFCAALAGCATHSAQLPANDEASSGMVLIPAGEFSMGSDKKENSALLREDNALNPYGFKERLYADEHPAHVVNLPAFYMDKYEVTNGKYLEFVQATKHSVPFVWAKNGYKLSDKLLSSLPLDMLRNIAVDKFKLDMDTTQMSQEEILAELDKIQQSRSKLPVAGIAWTDADAYCHWAGKRLPTEAEWEKAARGPGHFEYPWGNEWDITKINTMSEDPEAPYSAVGSYPGDKSGYGVYDMAANVAEWVADWYDAYPGADPKDHSKFFGKSQRVVRGGMTSSGHYDSISLVFRTSKRTHLKPYSAYIDVGFRCAKDASQQ